MFTNISATIASPKSSYSAYPLQSISKSFISKGSSTYLIVHGPIQSVVKQLARTWSCVTQDQQVVAPWFSSKIMLTNQISCLPSGQTEVPLPTSSYRILSQAEPKSQTNVLAKSIPLPQFPLRYCPTQ